MSMKKPKEIPFLHFYGNYGSYCLHLLYRYDVLYNKYLFIPN